ncbi:DUF4256 domain-containing protein [Candidatus Peregrinibacteria bacterium]|nr:DUF4256 domain-containing protein [Candidatus Peregrinibacteria bacterium]
MKLNHTPSTLAAAAVALLSAVTPSAARAEKMTGTQRACVQRVLTTPDASADAVRACVAAKAGSDAPDKAKKTLALDSPEALHLFTVLEARFSEKSPVRPKGVNFAAVKKALEARLDLLFSLNEMERTGGRPDVIAVEGNTFVFADVSRESPEGRRNLNYDEAKKMADAMGVKMMDEAAYRKLQASVPLDQGTWSWLLTDAKTRASGRALVGARDGEGVRVVEGWAGDRNPHGGWRGLLRVPKL